MWGELRLLFHTLAQRAAALFRLVRPDLVDVVELGEHLGARRQHHPGLLGRGEDVGVRRTLRRIVHGADAHEAYRRAGAGIVAPDGHLADRAAGDALALAAGRGRIDDLRLG